MKTLFRAFCFASGFCLAFWLLPYASSFAADSSRTVPTIELEKAVGDITGYYAVSGSHGIESYTGMATVSKAKDVYRVRWLSGPTDAIGIGMRVGDELVVGWAPMEVKDGKPAAIGVTRYRIHPGKLVGRWAVMPSGGGIGEETLEWLRGEDKK